MGRIIRDHNGEPVDYRDVGPIDPAQPHEHNDDCWCRTIGPDPFGVADPTEEELRAEAVAREDDFGAERYDGWIGEVPC